MTDKIIPRPDWLGDAESRIQSLIADNERLREALVDQAAYAKMRIGNGDEMGAPRVWRIALEDIAETIDAALSHKDMGK